MIQKYTFSGHESFPCKTQWLKKGYDFVVQGKDFNKPEAVIHLGIGKNVDELNKVFYLNWFVDNEPIRRECCS